MIGIRHVGRLARAPRRAVRLFMPGKQRPAILTYHRIARESFDPWGQAVDPARFAIHVEWLARNRTVLPLDELARRNRDGTLPPDAVALTLDDGYACAATVAAPLLTARGLPATIFLPIELIERGSEFWWDELERIVLTFQGKVLRFGDQDVALGIPRASDRRWRPGAPPRTPRQKAFHQLWAEIRTMPPKEVDAAVANLRKQSGFVATPRETHRAMTADEARSVRSATVKLGSHGLTHAYLPVLDLEEKRREIADSRGRCEAITGAMPATFAYPYGRFDPVSERLAEEAGYVGACTTERAFLDSRSRPFALPRLHVGNWGLRRFRYMLDGRW